MILEHAILQVDPDRAEEFEAAFGRARPLIAAQPGFGSLQLQRGIESPGRYVLLVTWDRLEDHTEGFRSSPEYATWAELLHRFYDPFPVVEHFEEVPLR